MVNDLLTSLYRHGEKRITELRMLEMLQSTRMRARGRFEETRMKLGRVMCKKYNSLMQYFVGESFKKALPRYSWSRSHSGYFRDTPIVLVGIARISQRYIKQGTQHCKLFKNKFWLPQVRTDLKDSSLSHYEKQYNVPRKGRRIEQSRLRIIAAV